MDEMDSQENIHDVVKLYNFFLIFFFSQFYILLSTLPTSQGGVQTIFHILMG